MNRVDAWEKVTGQAKYTADLMPQNLYTAKVVHSHHRERMGKKF